MDGIRRVDGRTLVGRSPFGFGFSPFGFGFGGMGFIFQALIFFTIVNFIISFISSMGQSNSNRRDDDDDMMGPPRY